MQRKITNDDVLSHPAFIQRYLNNHNYLLRDLPSGAYAISRSGDDRFMLAFKTKEGRLKGVIFRVEENGIVSNTDYYKPFLTYPDSIDSYLKQIQKQFQVELTSTLSSVIENSEDLKKSFAREQSPLIPELIKLIEQDLAANENHFRKCESQDAIERTIHQLGHCLSLDDQSAINLICKMMEDVNFYESGQHVGVDFFDGLGGHADVSNKPDRQVNYTYSGINDSELIKKILPNVRGFLIKQRLLNPDFSCDLK